MSRKNEKKENINQIAKVSGRTSFVEWTRDAFEIEKIHLGFHTYDESRAQGDRITSKVHIYLDIEEFLALCQDVYSYNMLRKKQNFDKTGNKYGDLFKKLGGTSIARLKKNERERPDGKAESRTFKIQPSSSKD